MGFGVSSRLLVLLVVIAILLSSVTMISVALAMYNLIDDKSVALLFSAAAVLLDFYKYLAWPVAIRVLRGIGAALMIFSILILSAVSGWATYDRMMSSINVSKAKHEAMSSERVSDLAKLAQKDSALITQLDKTLSDTTAQANDLRARGMPSKALELEESVGSRTSVQRAQALARLNAGSMETAKIKSTVAKASSLPPLLAELLCIGFAMALEIVPALILSAVRDARCSSMDVINSLQVETPSLENDLVPQQKQESETPKTAKTLLGSNDEILEVLSTTVRAMAPGTPVKLKEFAKNARIGNLRACEIFKAAEALGVIKKTTVGYVAL